MNYKIVNKLAKAINLDIKLAIYFRPTRRRADKYNLHPPSQKLSKDFIVWQVRPRKVPGIIFMNI